MAFDENNITILSSRDNIRTQLINYAKEYLDLQGVDWSKSSYLSYLINIMSVLTSNLIFYNTSIYREFFLTKALQKESVLNLSAMLGYTAQLATPSTGKVLVGLPIDFTSSVTITLKGRENWKTEISNDTSTINTKPFKFYANSTPFSVKETTVINVIVNGSQRIVNIRKVSSSGGVQSIPTYVPDDEPTTVYFYVDVIQIEDQIFEHTIPTLDLYEFYNFLLTLNNYLAEAPVLRTYSVDEDTNELSFVNTWDSAESLFLISPNDDKFVYRTTESGVRIYFGNGYIGKQPSSNNLVRVRIGTTLGSEGNTIAGVITKSDPIYGAYDGTDQSTKVVRITAINTTPTTGGDDMETIDDIRSNAIAQVSTNNRLVSKNDYDNLSSIDSTLPINNSTHILKVSDLKRNEISLFTDLIYQNLLVPTRNSYTTINIGSPMEINALNTTLTINGVEYYSLFDIAIDSSVYESSYSYLLKNITTTPTLSGVYDDNRTSTGETKVLPSSFAINTDGDAQTMDLTLYYNVFTGIDATDLKCQLTTEYDGAVYDLTNVYDSTDMDGYFTYSGIDISNMDTGSVTLTFYVYDGSVSDPTNEYFTCSSSLVIKQDLSDFMYSNVRPVTDDTDTVTAVKIYDIPVIQKTYYDSLTEDDKNAFILAVYQTIATFDVTDYRMINDFVNVKFSNTTGYITNMKYNTRTKSPIKGINPSTLPSSPTVGDRYAVSIDNNPWGYTGGFIIEYKTGATWEVTSRLVINDILEILDDDDEVTSKYLYNGYRFVDLITSTLTIPIEWEIDVWKTPSSDSTSSISEDDLVTNIKETLVDTFYDRFGFDKNIYLSEIVDTVHTVEGIQHCQVKTPDFDIFFDYETDDLTQTQLLEYTPDLIYFDTDSITINIRN